MDEALRTLVRDCAGHRCEYCRLHQDQEPFFTFHIEHIVARQHQGPDDETNLALACYQCNLHKGTNLTRIDPETGVVTMLFHPRRQRWKDHFAMDDGGVLGKTPEGRTTVRLLQMNAADRRTLRKS